MSATDWKGLEEHPDYGNIYYPFHIHDQGGLRYAAASADGQIVTRSVHWTVAVLAVQYLNTGRQCSVLSSITLEGALS